MTDERTFDRLARAWLELGPDEAPDRVIAAVLQATEATPQVRRPLRWPIWRSFPMPRLPIVATVVAILVVVIGGGLFLSRSNGPAQVGGPSPSPIASASPAPYGDPRRVGGRRRSRTRSPSCGWARRARSRASRRMIGTGSS